jgi:hypothetical protein
MAGPVTYAAVALLARDRLARIADAIDTKQRAGGTINALDRKVRDFAAEATRLLSTVPPSFPAPIQLYGGPRQQVSRYLMLGAIGPDLARFYDDDEPLNWIWNTLHKGSPDEHREAVVASSTDYAIAVWRAVKQLVDTEISDTNDNRAARDRAAAYLLGHLCHVAADVVSHPLYDDVAWHFSDARVAALDRTRVASAMDGAVARRFLQLGSPTGESFASWFPGGHDVDTQLFRALHSAFTDVYGGDKRRSFGELTARLGGPTLNDDFFYDAWARFRSGLESPTGYWGWFGFISWTFLVGLATLPAAAGLPHARNIYVDPKPPGYDGAVAHFEAAYIGFNVTSLVPLIFVLTQNWQLPPDGRLAMAWVSAILQLLFAIIFWIAGRGDDGGVPKWIFFFGLPLAIEIAFILYGLIGHSTDRRHRVLVAGALLHLFFGLGFWAGFHIGLHKSVEALLANPVDTGTFLAGFFAWFGVMVAAWFGFAAILDAITHDLSWSLGDDRFVSQHRHRVRLFDDSTLFRDPPGAEPALPALPPSPTLGDLFYPSGARALLKLWWNGANPPTLLSFRDRLVFQFGAEAPIVVEAPLAPTKASEYADYLKRVVKHGADALLQATRAFPDDPDVQLPPGEVFSDLGDAAHTLADHDRLAHTAVTLPTTDKTALTLYHAPKVRQSVRFGLAGPLVGPENDLRLPGTGKLTSVAATPTQIGVSDLDPELPLYQVLRVGDTVETEEATPQRRVVVSLDDETHFTVAAAFGTALANTAWHRAAVDRQVDGTPPGGWRVTSVAPFTTLTSAGSHFADLFRIGDRIRVTVPTADPAAPNSTPQPQDEERAITAVTDLSLTVDAPLVPSPPTPFVAGAPVQMTFVKVAEPFEDFRFVADRDDSLAAGGDALLTHAADLATLLCLGATSHVTADNDPNNAALKRAFQVFRNWNLDRRRVNEWRMLVLGGARSEKRGDPASRDFAVHTEAPAVQPGEEIANRLGWLPLLRRWFAVARNPSSDSYADGAFFPGEEKSHDLSQGLAFLLDQVI